MWGNSLAIKWGAERKAVTLNDGKGQGNNIAVFPTFLQGICAQMDLWRTSKNYRNKRFADAIAIWSGGNSVEQYIAFVIARAPGMSRDTIMDDAFWRGPLAIPFLKAQAWHEAGKRYPADDMDWINAKNRVLSGAPTPNTVKKAGGSITAGGGAATAAHQSGLGIGWVIGIGIAVAVAAFLILKFKNAGKDTPHPALVAPSPGPILAEVK